MTKNEAIALYNSEFWETMTFEERAKFSTWLFTITYRLALNQVNKKNITVTESDYHSNSDESESPIDTIQFDVDQQIDFSRYYEYDSKEVRG